MTDQATGLDFLRWSIEQLGAQALVGLYADDAGIRDPRLDL